MKEKVIIANGQNGFDMVFANDIIRCEAEGNYTYIYFSSGKKTLVTKKIKHFVSQWQSAPFLRIHRSHFVNLSHIVRYQNGHVNRIEMSDGSRIPVSKKIKPHLEEYILQETLH